MKRYTCIGLAGLAAALFAGQVLATVVCPNAPVGGSTTHGQPTCIATQGGDGTGTSLQDQINDITQSGSPQIDVYNDQSSPNAYWSIGATGSSENTLAFELAGNAGVNSFGIFDPTNSSNHLQLFSGPATSGWSASLKNMGNGNYIATYFNASGMYQSQTAASFGANNLFGYYLSTPNGFFFSDPMLNAPGGTTYPDGMRHMASYAGNGQTTLCITSSTCGLFLPNEYLLAWEDKAWSGSDLDYNDFVVMVESVHPVPEPAVLGMFGFGLLLIGAFAASRSRGARKA